MLSSWYIFQRARERERKKSQNRLEIMDFFFGQSVTGAKERINVVWFKWKYNRWMPEFCDVNKWVIMFIENWIAANILSL